MEDIEGKATTPPSAEPPLWARVEGLVPRFQGAGSRALGRTGEWQEQTEIDRSLSRWLAAAARHGPFH
eukprot:3385837-Rhodomonas_salina.2